MSFLTGATWPAGLVKIFEICRKDFNQYEGRYYGPYNKLLSYCFGPNSFEFFVAPQGPPGERAPREAVDPIVFFVVFDVQRRPVLMAEIKNDRVCGG